MPNEKIQQYTQLAAQTARQVTGSLERWTAFLDTAARLYKYPFDEQLLIYAQRPEATACADYSLWNERMGRYVRRGSKGIALLDPSGDDVRLRYVFDVSDTGGGRRPYIWQYQPEHEQAVAAALEARYDVPFRTELAEQFETIAIQLVDEYWNDHQRDILDIVDGSFLEEYDDFNIGAAFRSAAVASTTYTLLSRCGLEPGEYLGHEDFSDVFDFNTPRLVRALGKAVSQNSEEVLRRVEIAVKNYEHERRRENDRNHLQTERGLSDPEHRSAGADGVHTAGQVRTDAERIPEGAPPDPVERYAAGGDAVPAPAPDRPDGERAAGADDPGAGSVGGRDGGAEGQRPDGVGRADEQLQGPGRGDHSGGTDLQLTENEYGQASLFPSEAEQIETIDEAESVHGAPSALTFSQEEIDHFLRVGSNSEHARMRLVEYLATPKLHAEHVAFVRQMYHGGYGIQTAENMIAAWYAEDGIHLAQGREARYIPSAQIISWEDVTYRIGELLNAGQFATNVEVAEAHSHELADLSQLILFQYHDLTDEARQVGYLSALDEIRGGGYPDEVEKLSAVLADPAKRATVIEQFRQFAEAWQENPDILRFRFYRPAPLLVRLEDLNKTRHEYHSDMAELPEVYPFITEDEIDATLAARGSGVEGGKGRIYDYFTAEHTAKEKADFLKKEYGTGGCSDAVSHNPHSWQDHDSRGLQLRKESDKPIILSWSKVTKRIDALIAHDRYLSPEEMAARETVLAASQEQEKPPHDTPTPKQRKVYTTPNGITYRVGELYDSVDNQGSVETRLQLTGVDDGYIYYTFPDLPEQEPVRMFRDRFEDYLDQGENGGIIHAASESIQRIDELSEAPEPEQATPEKKRSGRSRVERNYRAFARQFPEIVSGEYRYLELRRGDGGLMPLTIQYIGENEIAMAHTYELNGDLMYDPEMTFRIDIENGTMEPLTFRQDGSIQLYQEVYPEPGRWIPRLRNDLSAFTDQWLKNIEAQGRIRYRAVAVRDGEDVEIFFDEGGQPVQSDAEIDREAERAIDAHEAEFGADGTRVFRDAAPQDEDQFAPITQEEIDDNLRSMFPDKHAIVRYMNEHGREKDTAAWLADQYYGTDVTQPLHISRTVTHGESPQVTLSWAKVQRRIAQLIREDKFYTEQEQDNFEDIDVDYVREQISRPPEESPFVQQVMADTARIAAEVAAPQPPDLSEQPVAIEDDTITIGDGPVFQEIDIELPEGLWPEETRETEKAAEYPEGSFEYQGYHFVPAGYFPGSADYDRLMKQDIAHNDLGISSYEDHKRPYSHQAFYAAAGNVTADVFVCVENGKYYVPGENELFEYTGSFTPYLERSKQTVPDGPIHEEAQPRPEAAETNDIAPRPGDRSVMANYNVGDTVYLDNTAFEITDIRDNEVQLRDPTLFYPILRSEPRERFEQLIQLDARNSKTDEYLAIPFAGMDLDLREVLIGDHGMMELHDREIIAGWFRNGESNTRIAERLGLMYAGVAETFMMDTGEGADYFCSETGLEIDIDDKYATKREFAWTDIAPYLRAMYEQERYGFYHESAAPEPMREQPKPSAQIYHTEVVGEYPAEETGLAYDITIEQLHFDEPEHEPPAPTAENFRIMDEHLGEGGPKDKFWRNIKAIATLKQIEGENRQATSEEQHILSQYVGWGGLPDAFDPQKPAWAAEYSELKGILTDEEYAAARASTLNAHYTSPTVIHAVYEALGNMGFKSGNILEPSMGVGNFFGMLPEEMRDSRLYGVELDSISGRIAQQLYPKANITVAGFETTDRRDFYDVAVGNVPFGQYQVNDRAYSKLGFNIHNYFFAKALDQVRPGGVVAFVTSRYTLDAKDPTVRKYLAQRAELLGAIRLPNNAFKANAGTEVVSDIIFLQKRDRPIDIEPEWIHTAENADGFNINSYFIEHSDMILGQQSSDSTQYGHQDFTVVPIEGAVLADQLHEAVRHIHGEYQEAELPDLGEDEAIRDSIPADPDVKNYSFTIVDGEVYYRNNSVMVRPELNATAKARAKGMIGLRDCVRELINMQMDEATTDFEIEAKQAELNRLYDAYTAKYGLINDSANQRVFADDSSYYLLCSLEVLDKDRKLERKADMFTKRTIMRPRRVEHVDTAVEALTVSIGEKARVDLGYMASLMGGSEKIPQIVEDLRGIIFKDPSTGPFDLESGGEHWSRGWQTADEYLSGNVRQKLRTAQRAAENDPDFQINVAALERVQPKDLDASEIEVRIGSTWIDKEYFQQFMYETFETPFWLRRQIEVHYSPYTAEWQITKKSAPRESDVNAYSVYGTQRANAYRLLEDALNLRDTRVYDTFEDSDGKQRRVLNAKETTLAQQKQQAIKDAFRDWIWRDPERREALVRQYNEEMNSTRPREYDGSHLVFSGMNPEITLREHQKNAIAHVIYGGNTLLAHEVGAGKTFEMVAAAMESKRLGLCNKSIFVVPNHLTDQWASEFLRLYPSANILVTTKKDFQPANRKKFCGRIATGDYDAVIIGHSQFEKIPISHERQERLLQEQIDEITEGIAELKWDRGEQFTVKQLEKTKKNLELRLEKLRAEDRKDDVITFEELGVDRLFVDESDNYKNLFLYTKMRNVAGLSTTDAQKSSDMFMKTRYMDELTGGRGTIFATGTPISNSMTEMYTIQRYLQYDRLRQLGMSHFDCWASRFGETVTALELAPEGTGYRARTRFAKFFNLPELMALFKEVADIKTADQLDLPVPEAEYHVFASKPTEIQREMVQTLSERATAVHKGEVAPTEDNMLKITSDGRKLGLDQRVINPMLPDEEGTKVNQCVENILQFWRDGEADKLTQLVFCDISTPQAKKPPRKAAKSIAGILDDPMIHALGDAIKLDDVEESRFTIYDDIRAKLIAGGMPAEQIAFIHDADNEQKKRVLFDKVRSGDVRVLMGSTAKMGAGTNVQDRLIALHDLDCPWRPRDLTQRAGRIIRQGNQNETVHICRYVTESTFDAYLWQTVENKQKFISQVMTSKTPVRSCEDVDETALSFAEIKALCAGDPRIKERMDLDVDVSRLKLMQADHRSQQFRLEDQLIKFFPQKIEENKGFIRGLEADMKALAEHPLPEEGFVGMEVRGDTLTDKENAGAALLDAIKELRGFEEVPIGSYRGFAMSAFFEPFQNKYILNLKGEMTHRVELGTDPRGNLTRIENALALMPNRLQAVQNQLTTLEQQQETAKAEYGKPFPQEQELAEKTARLIELDLELNLEQNNGMEAIPDDAAAKSEAPLPKAERPSVLAMLKQAPPPRETHERPHSKNHEVAL